MVEVFSGIAILCATAKQAGLSSSIAVDKTKKRSCRSNHFTAGPLQRTSPSLTGAMAAVPFVSVATFGPSLWNCLKGKRHQTF